MKKLRKIICLTLALIMASSTMASALELVPFSGANEAAARVRANSRIAEALVLKEGETSWNNNTSIAYAIPLYLPDNSIYGYIFDLTTNGEDAGYMQVDYIEGEYVVSILSEKGKNPYERAAQIAEGGKVERLYYMGGLDYCVSANDLFIDVRSGKVAASSRAELLQKYHQYKTVVQNAKVEQAAYAAAVAAPRSSYPYPMNVTVANFQAANNYYVTTSNFIGYHDHCSPTAGTNLILYWSIARGYSGLGTYSSSIFWDLYDRMGTATGVGTYPINILPALVSYCNSNGVSPSNYATITVVYSVSLLMDYICDDIPMILSCWSYDDQDPETEDENHTINLWGYRTYEDDIALYISENWADGDDVDREFYPKEVRYETLSLRQAVYIDF